MSIRYSAQRDRCPQDELANAGFPQNATPLGMTQLPLPLGIKIEDNSAVRAPYHEYSVSWGHIPTRPPAMMICRLLAVLLLVAGSPAAAAEYHLLKKAIDSITAEELRHHVYTLADDSFEGREAGKRGGRAASVYLEKALRELGCQGGAHGQFYQPFGAGLRNVLGLVPGTHPELQDEVVILGAHYDHIGYGDKDSSNGPVGYIHNGADDNASGNAALLEIAEALYEMPDRPDRSILFAFWDGEEKGLLGSTHWAQHPTLPMEQVAISINLDMIGRLGGDGVEVSGTRSAQSLRQWVSRRNAVTDLKLYFPWKTDDSSDHWPFYELGVPVIMFHTGLHDDYHRPSDDAHLVNIDGMQQVTGLIFRCVHDLASETARHAFRQQSRQEQVTHRQALERTLNRPPPRLGTSWSATDQTEPGVRLTQVDFGTPAQRAGLRVGDRVLKINGQATVGGDGFRRQIQIASPDVTMTIQRAGSTDPLDVPVRLAGPPLRLGISWRTDAGEPDSVTLVRVVEGSPAGRAGLKPRDRIYEVNGQRFSDSDEFAAMASAATLPATLLVERWGRLREVSLVDELAKADAATQRRE